MPLPSLFGAVALAAVTALAVAGCGDDSEPGVADLSLVTPGTLTVCTYSPYQPFEFEEDGEWTGFDMQLVGAIAGDLGLDLEITSQPFEDIWLAPEAGVCDLVASAMAITPERQEAALFSDPYFNADQSLLTRADDASIFASLADLAGGTLAVQADTTGEVYAEENAPEDAVLRVFDGASSMFDALAAGEVDAILQDLPVNGYRSTHDSSVVVTRTFPTGEQYGFAAAKDADDLIDVLNGELEELREGGEYDDIYAEWFGPA